METNIIENEKETTENIIKTDILEEEKEEEIDPLEIEKNKIKIIYF